MKKGYEKNFVLKREKEKKEDVTLCQRSKNMMNKSAKKKLKEKEESEK